MTTEELANIADIGGSIAVIFTLGFLAFQVRRARLEVARQNARDMINNNNDVLLRLSDNDALLDVHIRGQKDYASLTETERMKWGFWLFAWITQTEQGYIDRHKVKVHRVDEVRKQGAEHIVAAALEYLKHCDMVYVSFDIDSLDAALVPGTGTPVAGGLTEEEAAALLTGFWQSPKLAALEFCEINPLLDIQGRTPQLACRLLEAVLLGSTRPS